MYREKYTGHKPDESSQTEHTPMPTSSYTLALTSDRMYTNMLTFELYINEPMT